MKSSKKIKEYLNKVCDQIRWKKSHEIISEEIEDHINDQKNDFMSKGLDEETAIDRTILEMGDPIDVGTGLDSVYRPKPEWSIIILTGILLVLGIFIRNFARYSSGMPQNISKEIVLSLMGIGVMGIAYFLDFTFLGKFPRAIYLSLILITIGSNITSTNIKDVLPNINTDFILTNLIYTYGWLAFMGLMALVVLFIVKSIQASLKQKGILGSLVSMSIIITFIIQVIFYLINNLGLIYVDPLSFPLISNGGTGLIINMFLIGIMLSVYKSKALSSSEEKIINRFKKKEASIFSRK